jgi:hypothetical protein
MLVFLFTCWNYYNSARAQVILSSGSCRAEFCLPGEEVCTCLLIAIIKVVDCFVNVEPGRVQCGILEGRVETFLIRGRRLLFNAFEAIVLLSAGQAARPEERGAVFHCCDQDLLTSLENPSDDGFPQPRTPGWGLCPSVRLSIRSPPLSLRPRLTAVSSPPFPPWDVTC